MRILLIVAGIILIIVGIGSAIGGAFGSIMNMMAPAMDLAQNYANADDEAAALCNDNETLEKETGASEYTIGQGYASSVVYTCVDPQGNRRDVTGEFAEKMVGDVAGALNFNFSFSPIGLVLPILGVALIFAGLMMRGRKAATVDVSGMMGSIPGARVVRIDPRTGNAPVDLGQLIGQKTGGVDLTTRLKQLDEARAKGLISQEEYDRLRQQILDSMR
ncbi:MAG: SHOCT domain-containing protein [Anaerolineae bacterium]|nr:SHOCT domain-containing protein [Anaerolineae bacterium]